jgi:nicotinamidase-related amidase
VPALAAAVAASGVLDRIAALGRAARAAGVPVVHCTAESRTDRLGGNRNARLFALTRKETKAEATQEPQPESTSSSGGRVDPAAFAVHPRVGVEPSDIVLPRLHGVSPMTGTSVDPVLRNLGVTTIVATGVSVNVALLGLAFEAVNLGYQLVVPRDAVAGVDEQYVEAVFEHTLSLLVTVTTTESVLAVWQAEDPARA